MEYSTTNKYGYFGGICGRSDGANGIIISCISIGNVNVAANGINTKGAVGGICGKTTEQNYSIANYAIGTLSTGDYIDSYIGGVTGMDRPHSFQIESNYWLEGQGAVKRFGNITNTGDSDIIGRKTSTEMQNAADGLNQAINAWNQANSGSICEYEFYDVPGAYPKLRKK